MVKGEEEEQDPAKIIRRILRYAKSIIHEYKPHVLYPFSPFLLLSFSKCA